MELTLRLTRCWFSSNLFYRDFSKNMSMFNWCFVPQFIYRTWRLTTKRINNNKLKWKHEVANSRLALLSGVDFFSEASQGNARSRWERSNVFFALEFVWRLNFFLDEIDNTDAFQAYTKVFFSSKWSLDHESNKKCSDAVHSITLHLVEASFSRRHGQLKKLNGIVLETLTWKRQCIILRKGKILYGGVLKIAKDRWPTLVHITLSWL